jgi:hypothetical protein
LSWGLLHLVLPLLVLLQLVLPLLHLVLPLLVLLHLVPLARVLPQLVQ